MGYTHYWYVDPELPSDLFGKVVADFRKLLPRLLEIGIPLAGPMGDGEPIITDEELCFNGREHCGHPHRDIGIAWPSAGAGGIADVGETPIAGEWFAGALLEKRTCGGDCSHESFVLERVFKPYEWQKPMPDGKLFAFCKTAYKPYDLAVTAALLIARHHLGDRIRVASDGTAEHWFDARLLCQAELGYGLSTPILEEEEEVGQ